MYQKLEKDPTIQKSTEMWGKPKDTETNVCNENNKDEETSSNENRMKKSFLPIIWTPSVTKHLILLNPTSFSTWKNIKVNEFLFTYKTMVWISWMDLTFSEKITST